MKTLNILVLCLVISLNACARVRTQDEGVIKEAFSPKEKALFFGHADWVTAKLSDLPASANLPGRAWPAHYWPGYRNGLLHRFFDERKSPLEKFEAAFSRELAAANPDYKPGDLAELERARVKGVTTNWFGICDGSSEASLNFSEPQAVRSANGQIFYPYEIKALLSYFTAMSSEQRKMMFAGNRVAFSDPNFDGMGRGVDSRFRDINPGLFHLALANYVGLNHRGMVADTKPSNIVLNFPIKGYDVLVAAPVTDPEKIAVYKRFNTSATAFVDMRTAVHYGESHRVLETLPNKVDPTVTMTYDYRLELDGQGAVIGGEWLDRSRADHPDFLWLATTEGLDPSVFVTTRLPQKIAVGTALTALLNAAEMPDSDERIAAHVYQSDNFAGYKIFDGSDLAPLPPAVAEILPH